MGEITASTICQVLSLLPLISTLTQLSMGIVGLDMEPLVPRCRGK